MEPVYIVAGGPSLADFDWSSLNGKDVIAINNAAFKLPNAKYVYFCNRDWFEMWKNALKAHKGKIIQGSIPGEAITEDWIDHWDFVRGSGLSMEPYSLSSGTNSGYAAINLAVQLGYTRIFLLGYDMKWKGERSNFHTDHLWTTQKESFDGFLKLFETIVEPLNALGVEVINLTKDSALSVFPLGEIENDDAGSANDTRMSIT